MHIEPTFHDHLEAIVAVARADAKAVDSAHVGTTLPGLAADAGRLLGNLEAGGLLCAQRGRHGRMPAYRLARRAEEIRLDEIAALADAADSAPRLTPSTAAQAGTDLLSAAVRQHALSVLAGFTVADIVASPGNWTDTGASEATPIDAPANTADRAPIHDDPGSVRLGITVSQLRRQVDAGTIPLVLDVRACPDSRWPAPSWAHWIPLDTLTEHVPARSSDTRIVTVCRLGVRSLVAASYLRACGFTRCDPLIGGLEAWNSGRE